ncbi:MAG: hypothetical protein C0412_18230 [Flavobacterium sp.]|nr:hypothetical protein [Flavobacterium sp.]
MKMEITMKDSTVTARINSHLKREAEDILKKIGLNNSSAISLFYSSVVLNKGIPFRLRLDSVPDMEAKEQTDIARTLKKRISADKQISKVETVKIAL